MNHRNPYTLREGENMQRQNPGKAMRYLVVVCALISALTLVGCGGGGDDDGGTVSSGETIGSVDTGTMNVNSSTVQALVGQSFTFQNGSIFDPSIGNNPATLTFTGPTTFSLTSGSSTSSGNTTFGSCTFTFTQGVLAGKSVKFDPCTIQITTGNVTVGGGAVSGTFTLTLGTTRVSISVQINILADGTLVINGRPTGIIISSDGSPITIPTGTGGAGGTQ
jgi:hypothetical protein